MRLLVTALGFKPKTFSSVVRRSIQLSYAAIYQNIKVINYYPSIQMGCKNRDLFYSSQLFPHFCHINYSMKLQFWSVGKASESYVKEGIELFTRRIANYYPVEWHIIPMPKN